MNLAQSFNPMGSLLGMYVAMNFIQNRLSPMDTMERSQFTATDFEAVRDSDLSVLIAPYLIIGIVILVMLILIRMVKMPKNADQSHDINFFPTLKRIFSISYYREGVIAQFFYVGAQIMLLDVRHTIWHTFIYVPGDGGEGGRGVVAAV